MAPRTKGVKRKAAEGLTSTNIFLKGNAFLEDRQCSNHLLDILSSTLGDDEHEVVAAQNTLQKVFVVLLEGNQFYSEKPLNSSTNHSDENSEQVYMAWLQDCYADAKNQLLENLHHTHVSVRQSSLNVMMKLVEVETLHPIKPTSSICCFPTEFFMEIISKVLYEENEESYLILQFQEFLQYADITFHVLKVLLKILKKRQKKHNGRFLFNVFSLLSKISLPEPDSKKLKVAGAPKTNNLIKYPDSNECSSSNYSYMRKLFASTWTALVAHKLPAKLYKKILVTLDDILPCFQNPLVLTDFLTRSYEIGGAISLLSLSGLFSLMQNYNLEYPDFYKKFYALCEPSVLHSQHRMKFFTLADLFLSSTHIPEYLVAAFVKRLSRLSLEAPVPALLIIVPFICNLLIRHPQLKVLIDQTKDEEAPEDPYIMEEENPAKCRALESSLWEIQTLQFHWHPDVAIKARFIKKPLPKMENDASEFYNLDSHKVFQKELQRKYKEVPMNFDRPFGLFQRKEDLMKDMWSVE